MKSKTTKQTKAKSKTTKNPSDPKLDVLSITRENAIRAYDKADDKNKRVLQELFSPNILSSGTLDQQKETNKLSNYNKVLWLRKELEQLETKKNDLISRKNELFDVVCSSSQNYKIISDEFDSVNARIHGIARELAFNT